MPTLDERIAAIEARLGPVPLAVPPITIGELTNVPAPGSPIAAQWAQDVSSRVVQRFPTTAALKAWAAPAQALAVAGDTGFVWRRLPGGAWSQFTPWTGRGIPIAASAGAQVVNSLTIPADPGPRMAVITAFLHLDVFNDNTVDVNLRVNGSTVASAFVPRTLPIAYVGANMDWNLCLSAGDVGIPIGAPITVEVICAPNSGGAGVYHTQSNPITNRLDVLAVPKGS